MKYLITESSLDKIVGKLLNSKQKLMPDEEASKIIRMYLKSNPDVSIEHLIFEKLDNQNFTRIEKENNLYFFYEYEDEDDFAYIKYDEENGWCFIYFELVGQISFLFSLNESDTEKIIGKWVENILQDKVTETETVTFWNSSVMRMPRYIY